MRPLTVLHVVGGVCVSTLMLSGCGETSVRTYATRAAAEADGAISRGWVPDAVPHSAAQIVECHDLDTNRMRGTFVFESSDQAAFRARLGSERQVDSVSISAFEGCPVDVSALERDLRGWTAGGPERGIYRRHDEGALYLAVDWHARRAFYWNDQS